MNKKLENILKGAAVGVAVSAVAIGVSDQAQNQESSLSLFDQCVWGSSGAVIFGTYLLNKITRQTDNISGDAIRNVVEQIGVYAQRNCGAAIGAIATYIPYLMLNQPIQ